MTSEEGPGPDTMVEQSWQRFRRKWELALYTLILLIASVGNQVYFKRITTAMPNYGWYLTQLSGVVYIPFFAVCAGFKIKQGTKKHLLVRFAFMAAVDCSTATCMVLGGTNTSGTLQVILGQAVIPLSIAFSIVLLAKTFHLLQYGGAALIVGGIILASVACGSDSSNSGAHNTPLSNFIFLLAFVPASLSSVLKELSFKDSGGDLDVMVLQFWICACQFFINFLFMPVYSLKILGPSQVPLGRMPYVVLDGTQCLFFQHDPVELYFQCGLPGEKPCDQCDTAWKPVMSFFFFNIMYNVFMVLVIKHGSAALAFLVSTLRMPISSLAFSSSLIMGADAVAPSSGNFISLAVIFIGLCMYRYGGHLLDSGTLKITNPDVCTLSPRTPVSPASSCLSPSRLTEPLKRHVSRRLSMMPLFSSGLPVPQPTFVLVRPSRPARRSVERLRGDFYSRLGAASPLQSPQMRHLLPTRSPPATPSPRYQIP